MLTKTKIQSLQASIIQILAAGLGALSTLFLYPADLELYGIYGYLTNTASLLVPFVSLGFGSVMLRFYPYYKDPTNQHKGFFGFVITAYGIGIVIFVCIFCISYSSIVQMFHAGNKISAIYHWVLPFTILLVAYEFTSQLCINFQKISWTAMAALALKVFLPIIFFLSLQDFIEPERFIVLIFLYYACAIFLLIWKIQKSDAFFVKFSKDLFAHSERRKLWQYAAFSILSGTSAVLALRIDSFFVGSMIGAEATGLFTLAMFMSNVVFIPATAITDALNPSLARFSKEGDHASLLKLYRSGSLHMMMATFFLSVILFVSFDALSAIMPNAEKIQSIKIALILLLFSRAIDAATGTNHHILSYSNYYRYELYLLIGMAVLNVFLNFYLIPQWGITGAAFATFLAVGLYNILKTLIVYRLMDMQPFTIQNLKVLVISFATAAVYYNAFQLQQAYLNLILQILFTSTTFLLGVYLWKCSPELNDFIVDKWKARRR